MSRDDVAKVLDLERPFESGRKEAAEGSDDGGEEGEEEGVDEEGVEGDRLLHVEQPSPRGQCLHRFEGFQHENIALAYLSTRRDFGDGDAYIIFVIFSPHGTFLATIFLHTKSA